MQSFVDGLLSNVSLQAFGTNVLFVCTGAAEAPVGFEACLTTITAESDLSTHPDFDPAVLEQTSVMVILAQLADDEQMKAVLALSRYLRCHPLVAPPVLLVPNKDYSGAVLRVKIQHLLSSGSVDDIVVGAPAGFALALSIKAKLSSLNVQLDRLQDNLQGRASRLEARNHIAASIDFAQWQYLRSHLFSSIPPVRNNLSDADPSTVAGFELGTKLSRGVFGMLHLATRPVRNVADTYQYCSMLILDKTTQPHGIHQMKVIHRFMRVMQQLDNIRHPNLSHLIATFHSPKRLCFCMEVCGTRTLFTRLKRRDHPQAGVESAALKAPVLQSIIVQVSAAIAHLHDKALMCHRDTKPENFTILEYDDDAVCIKLGGFELAMVQNQGQLCRSACGTMPFAAPEAILGGRNGYDGMAADMWSMGMLFLEVTCGLRSIEDALSGLNKVKKESSMQPSLQAADAILRKFARPGAVETFCDRMVPDAVELRPWLVPLVTDLVKVNPEDRMTAAALAAALPFTPTPAGLTSVDAEPIA